MPLRPTSTLPSWLPEIECLFPGRCGTGESLREHHANSLTLVAAQPPDAVVFPETTAEVQELVRLAARHRLPLIAFGSGTSLEGHVNAPRGGVAVDFSRMNRVLAVRSQDLDCAVEPGVTLKQLAAELKPTGLFFPVDPGAEHATLGGMAATRASGTTTVRYGSMRDNVVAVTAVMASGDVVTTARRARKSAAGYDLTRLLVGSEGTLGLITALTLKLYGVPESASAAVAAFGTVGAACETATLAIQMGLGVARLELLDAEQIRCVNGQSGLQLAELPTLFVEFQGTPASCAADLTAFGEVAAATGGIDIKTAADEDGRRQIWRARHDAFWAVRTAWPGRQLVVTDVAVPLSALAAVVTDTEADIREFGLTAPIVGHVGDGNFHCIVAIDPADAGARARIDTFLERLVQRALDHDGTATGEHGIGQGKARFLAAEHGCGVEVMQAIKTALDPLGILNPGKIFA